MPVYQQDMSQVADAGEPISRGWHRWRIESQEDKESVNSPGERTIHFRFVCQDEPEVGRVQMFYASLQAHALMGLKAVYKACDYHPGPEGHDPEKVVGAEFYAKNEWEDFDPTTNKGKTMPAAQDKVAEGHQIRGKIAPWNFRTLAQGVPNK